MGPASISVLVRVAVGPGVVVWGLGFDADPGHTYILVLFYWTQGFN